MTWTPEQIAMWQFWRGLERKRERFWREVYRFVARGGEDR